MGSPRAAICGNESRTEDSALREVIMTAAPTKIMTPEDTLDQPIIPTYDRIAERAYCLWTDRGCPADSAEEDWLEAERQLKQENGFGVTAGL